MFMSVLDCIGNGMDLVTKQVKLHRAMKLLEEFSQDEDIPVTLQIKGKQITFKRTEPTIRDHRFEDFLNWATNGQEVEEKSKEKKTDKKTK